MKKRERIFLRDFIPLFNAFWYKDFPIVPERIDISRRALWSTHIASTVKQCADHLGLFTCFETGNRTDAIIQDLDRNKWSKIEWEWAQPINKKFNEINKLKNAARNDEAVVFICIAYSNLERHDENIKKISNLWRNINKPLLVFLVTFSLKKGQRKKRKFEEMQSHIFHNGIHKVRRTQKALPWEVEGTKWYMKKE